MLDGNLFKNHLELFEIADSLFIISGTPFLFYQKERILILSDLHLGQHSSISLQKNHKTAIDQSLIELVKLIAKVKNRFDIKIIIVNGDVKHASTEIYQQEINEFSFFIDNKYVQNLHYIFIKGNHDQLLRFSMRKVKQTNYTILDDLHINEIYLHHGHQDIFPENAKIIILGHEHPSFKFRGKKSNGAIRLPAFAKLTCSTKKEVIILPAANDMSSGVRYPPKHKEQFMCSYLKKYANLDSIILYPFQQNIGLFPIPYPKL